MSLRFVGLDNKPLFMDVESYSGAQRKHFRGLRLWKNNYFLLFKIAHFRVLHIFERRRGSQTSRCPGKLVSSLAVSTAYPIFHECI